MAKREEIVYECDKCHTQDKDPEKFLHVEVSVINPHPRKVNKVLTSRDLCIESCVGAPGVNRDTV